MHQRFLGVLAVMLMLGACASTPAKTDNSINLEVSGDALNGLSIAVSAALAREVVEGFLGSELDCNGDLDPEIETLLRRLDQGGRYARATLRDNGSTIRAKRRGKKLRVEIEGDDGAGGIELTMQWAVAECLLGRPTTIDQALGTNSRSTGVTVKIEGENGGVFSFAVN